MLGNILFIAEKRRHIIVWCERSVCGQYILDPKLLGHAANIVSEGDKIEFEGVCVGTFGKVVSVSRLNNQHLHEMNVSTPSNTATPQPLLTRTRDVA